MHEVGAGSELRDPQSFESVSNQITARSPWQIFWRRFRDDRLAVVGAVGIGMLIVIAIAAPLAVTLTGHDPNDTSAFREVTDEMGFPEGPQPGFWFGADSVGRDVFVRIIYGTRVSLTVAIIATSIQLSLGITLGLFAGYYGGKLDTVFMRTADVFLSIPTLLLAIGVVGACSQLGLNTQGCLGGLLKPGIFLISSVIGFFGWPYIARIVRGQVLSLREKEFIEAARAVGASNLRIIFKEVLPNVLAPILVYATLVIPQNILTEAGLSYLGLGVPLDTPSWGGMIRQGAGDWLTAWWLLVFPGVFLLLTTLSFNLAGDGLRDALDPKTASR